MVFSIYQKANLIRSNSAVDPLLRPFVDFSYPIPQTHLGQGEIKLIILGQDPTVNCEKSRARIKTVLNLNQDGHLRRYLEKICKGLGLDLDENIYATNYFKAFFVKPPTQIKEIDVFEAFAPYWLPLLREEISLFPDVPIIALGEPLLATIATGDASKKVRDYWGYTDDWKVGETEPFHYLKPQDNILDRRIFPFPHQPSLRKKFYQDRLPRYIEFTKLHLKG